MNSLTPVITNISPADIGEFDKSDEFVNAPSSMVYELGELIPNLSDEVSTDSMSLGEWIVHYARKPEPTAQIIASFLNKARQDAGSIINDTERAFELPANLLYYRALYSEPQQIRHKDPRPEGAPHGLRYITVNSFPTVVEGVHSLKSGSVARLVLGRDFHYRPNTQSTPQQPRLLMSVDIY